MAKLALAGSLLLSLLFLSSSHRLLLDSSSDAVAIRLPSSSVDSADASTSSSEIGFQEGNKIPLDASLIPVGHDLPPPRFHTVWHRLGRHCHHHVHHGHHEGMHRGAVIPYGDDMIVPAEHVRRGHMGGRLSSHGEHEHMMPMMSEISVEELAKHRETGLPREIRPFRRFRPENHEEDDGGLVKRFLDMLNHH